MIASFGFADLARPVHVRMHNSHVPGQGIVPGKGLLLGTEVAAHFLLPGVVDRVFVTGEVIRSREDRVARLAGGWISPVALVGSSLRISETKTARSGLGRGRADGRR